MDIDIRTLLVVHALVSLSLTVLMVVFWRGHRSTPGLAHWTWGTALFGLGVLFGGSRGFIPDFLAIVAANVIGLIGMACFWNGIRLFAGRPARWREIVAGAGGVTIFLAYQTYVVNDIRSRIILLSVVLIASALLCVFELWRGPVRTQRAPALFAASIFLMVVATLAFRAVAVIATPPGPDLFASNPAQSAHFLVALIAKILVVVALLMMALQKLQQELEARNADLEAARNRAEEASRGKSEFLATMSHELRTPLNAIIGFSDVQRQELFGPLGNPRYREYAEHIHGSGVHLLDLITSVLDISKAEAGKLELAPVELDPCTVIDAAVPLIRGAAEAKQIRLSVDAPETPPVCRADPQALKQILLNLLSNAVKFTPEGGAVAVGLRALAKEMVEFSVRDTGIGIAASELPRLMKPFEQAARGYARRNGGTGLGLPLVDCLVRLHGGTMNVESAVGVGTVVTVRLPTWQGSALAAAE